MSLGRPSYLSGRFKRASYAGISHGSPAGAAVSPWPRRPPLLRRAGIAVIEPLADMPAGTLGFRATGRVTQQEFRAVLEPPLRAAVEAGEVRMVFALGPGFEMLEPRALAEDVKAAITLGFAHLHAWKRAALVTDVELVAHAWRLTAWMTPIEVAIYDLDGLEDAKAWVAAD